MVIYDIPKEYRQSTKLDMSFNFARIKTILSYISVRNKSTNEEVAFYAMNINYVIDISKVKSSFDFDVIVSVVYDKRIHIDIDYFMYDVELYRNVDYIRSL